MRRPDAGLLDHQGSGRRGVGRARPAARSRRHPWRSARGSACRPGTAPPAAARARRRAEMAALRLERRDHLRVDRVDHDERVLRRAGGRVVEASWSARSCRRHRRDRRSRRRSPGRCRRRPRSPACRCGRPRGRWSGCRCRRPGRPPASAAWVRGRSTGCGTTWTRSSGRPIPGEAGAHQVDRARAWSSSRRARRDDDRVPALERHHRLVDRGRRRVGRRA